MDQVILLFLQVSKYWPVSQTKADHYVAELTDILWAYHINNCPVQQLFKGKEYVMSPKNICLQRRLIVMLSHNFEIETLLNQWHV